jgi:hypothetical protein
VAHREQALGESVGSANVCSVGGVSSIAVTGFAKLGGRGRFSNLFIGWQILHLYF